MMRKVTLAITIVIFLSISFSSLVVYTMGDDVQVNSIQKKRANEPSTVATLIRGTILYVDNNNTGGPWDGTPAHPYQYIQDGIDNATAHDTVYIYNGTYYEHLVVNKSLTLVGETTEKTIVDGLSTDTVVHIQADEVILQDLTVRNSGGYTDNAGIYSDAHTTQIRSCLVYRTKTGIALTSGAHHEINNCTLGSNGGGITLQASEHTMIEGCTIYHNAIGIQLEDTIDTRVQFCYLHTNGIACLVNTSANITFLHCNISDNSDNHGGVFITDSSNSTLSQCIIRHNGMGVNAAGSDAVTIEACTLWLNTHFAIYVQKASNDIVIANCDIANNFRFGIYLVDNSIGTLTDNNIDNNTLQSLYSKNAHCTATNNWWGSPFGPSYTELRKASRITWRPGSLRVIPWLVQPLDDTGPGWEHNEAYMNKEIPLDDAKHLAIPGVDTDTDGAPDWWELKYAYDPLSWDDHVNLDPDHDGLTNVEECYTDHWGSHPFQQDIFVEIDWIAPEHPSNPSNKPSHEHIGRLISIFENQNITLHVDTGGLSGGEEIPYQSNFSFADLRDLYWKYFLHNDVNNPRKGIFHYGLVCDYGPDVNFPFIGWDQFDSFLVSAQWLQDKFPFYCRQRLIVGATVHQLGSTLGLLADTHGGNDNLGATIPFTIQWLQYRNYKSCMNYYYKYKLFSYSDGSHGWGDYNDWIALDFSFFKNTNFEWPKP